MGQGPAGHFLAQDDYTCGNATYAITCECPLGQCKCAKNGQPAVTAKFTGCGLDAGPLPSIYAACGFPE